MLQRQIMFKQLEELQRQKKLQGLNDPRQQNVINQQSLIHTKQASGAQYAPLINGTPVHDPSQLFMFGNPSLIHGFQNGSPYSQAQNQVLNSINLASQPLDGHSFSRSSHFHGSTREPTGEQMDIVSRSSMSDQFNVSYPEKNVFGSGFSQEQDTNTCQDYTSLDPLEQKFLFSSDDDNLGSLFEENDNNNSQQFPSVQSGSWSALMQSALEETSSTDTGVQEEWSGLSFQNPELSNDNQNNNLIESGKNTTLWQNNIFQNNLKSSNASSSFPVFHQGPSGHAGDFEFVNDVSNNGTEFNKGFLPSKASEMTTFRSSDSSGMSVIVDRSSDIPTVDSNVQTSRHMLELLHKVENSSTPQYVGLRLGPPTQRPPMNYFDLSQTSQLTGPLKDQDGQRSSIFDGQQVSNSISQPNVWVDIPPQQNLADVANNSMETTSEASGHVLNSQGFGYTKGQESNILFEEESNASLLKQAHISPLNPAYTDPKIRATIKNEKVDSGPELPQLTSHVYENYKTLLVPSSTRDDPTVKNLSHIHRNNSFVQMNLASTSQHEAHSFAINKSSSNYVLNQDLLLSQSKKRKFPTYEFVPFHKEATKGSSKLQDMSIAELEWAHATNRVPEKLKEDSETLVHPKKRIIFTTQLMQVLFQPVPTVILSENATECYNTITYFAARLALGDACSFTNHFHKPNDISDTLSKKNVISKGSGDQNLSNIVQDFVDRAKKLEDELLRLENGGSFLEIRMETQDLERFAVINRFGKFHSRAQMVAAAPETGSSGGGPTVTKLYPQRYVTASAMPKIVPEGHNYLSL